MLPGIAMLQQVVHAAEGILGSLEVASETLVPVMPLGQD